MRLTRRSAILGSLSAGMFAQPLLGCSAAEQAAEGVDPTKTRLHVMGVIHGQHRGSDTYSLDILRAAVREADPDVILTEIPPDRIDQAISSFQETGEIDEPRTEVFPEYTDVVFPLSREMDFRMFGTAGWTRELADNRRDALEQIRSDPDRADQWAEYQQAQREFSRKLNGRGDDPVFIHTDEFDALVKESREPYEAFDDDLGAGGWTQINKAHTDLINGALDTISGRGLRALVMFGTAHKYKILEAAQGRDDIELLDTQSLFA